MLRTKPPFPAPRPSVLPYCEIAAGVVHEKSDIAKSKRKGWTVVGWSEVNERRREERMEESIQAGRRPQSTVLSGFNHRDS